MTPKNTTDRNSKTMNILRVLTSIITFFTAIIALSYIIIEKGVFISGEDKVHLEKFEGKWKGTLIQSNNTDTLIFPKDITIRMSRNYNELSGKFDFNLKSGEDDFISEFELKGTKEKNEFLKIDYWCIDKDCTPFGSMVLKINSKRNEMSGKLIGYGATSEEIINAQIELKLKS